jgi:hypothetical protein
MTFSPRNNLDPNLYKEPVLLSIMMMLRKRNPSELMIVNLDPNI